MSIPMTRGLTISSVDRQSQVVLQILLPLKSRHCQLAFTGNGEPARPSCSSGWQQDLERRDFKAVYFNAWEDDFRTDPLLAIIGQLHSYFSEGRFREGVKRVTNSALPLVRSNVSNVLNHFAGLTTDFEHDLPTKGDLFEQYLGQRNSKDTLKSELEKLSATVYTESNHPLIFIVDELDRCRPTFAIELLERVKHIFDVPRLVFVFGLNPQLYSQSAEKCSGDGSLLSSILNSIAGWTHRSLPGIWIERFQIGEVFPRECLLLGVIWKIRQLQYGIPHSGAPRLSETLLGSGCCTSSKDSPCGKIHASFPALDPYSNEVQEYQIVSLVGDGQLSSERDHPWRREDLCHLASCRTATINCLACVHVVGE